MQMQRAPGSAQTAGSAEASRAVEEGAVFRQYLPTGKLKNSRHFWISIDQGTVCWDKKKNAKPNKSAPLLGVQAELALKSARQWFDTIDVDGSGELDATELATLYQTARHEKLSKKELRAAMASMDTDGSGSIDFTEFEAWWRSTGGDLEKHREQAFTVVAGDAQLLLVAPTVETKRMWVNGLTDVLRSLNRLGSAGPEPELAPELEQHSDEEAEGANGVERGDNDVPRHTGSLIAEIFGHCDTTGSGVLDKGQYKRYLQTIKEWGTGQYTDRRYDAQWIAEATSMGCDPTVGITRQAFEEILYGKYRTAIDVVRQDLALVRDSGQSGKHQESVRVVEEGCVLTLYTAAGKKKHDRYFWASAERGLLMWDKKKNLNPNKSEPLMGIDVEPLIQSARDWFDAVDVDRSGELSEDEVANLYYMARGENLSTKQLRDAIASMDSDRSGSVDFAEFERWWHEHGGGLEEHRDLAFTVHVGVTQLHLVAPDKDTKARWVDGLQAVLHARGRSPLQRRNQSHAANATIVDELRMSHQERDKRDQERDQKAASDSKALSELRARLAAAETQLEEAHQAVQRSVDDAQRETARVRQEAMLLQEQTRLEERAAAKIQREYRESQNRQTLQAVRQAAAAKAVTVIEKPAKGAMNCATSEHTDAGSTNGLQLEFPEGVPPADVAAGTPRLSPKTYPLIEPSRIAELTSPRHAIPNGSVTSSQWADADLYMDSALAMARMACAASRRYPADLDSCTHAIDKLKLAEEAIGVALARPSEYDETMMQALQKRLKNTQTQLRKLETHQRLLTNSVNELQQPKTEGHAPAERAISPMSQANARRRAAQRAGQRFSNSNHAETKACKSPRSGRSPKKKSTARRRKKGSAATKEKATKREDDGSPGSSAHQHAKGCVCRRCVSYAHPPTDDTAADAVSSSELFDKMHDGPEVFSSSFSEDWNVAHGMLTRLDQDSSNFMPELIAAPSPEAEPEPEAEPVFAACAIIGALKSSPRLGRSSPSRDSALKALRAEAAAEEALLNEEAQVRTVNIPAKEEEAVRIVAEEAKTEAARIAFEDTEQTQAARVAAEEEEAETEAARIAAAEEEKAKAEAARIAAAEEEEAEAEAARIAAAEEEEAEAEAARVAAAEEEAEAEAARIAAAEEEEAKAEAARIAAAEEEEAEAEAARVAADEEEAKTEAARIVAEEEEAEAEAARIVAAEEEKAKAEAARIAAAEEDAKTEAARVAAEEEEAEAEAARVAAEEEEAEAEAARIAAAEEEKAKAEAARIAAEEGSDASSVDGSNNEYATAIAISCPDGSGPGDLILIEGPDGEDIEVVVPDGVGPGETFEYDLDAGTGNDMQDTGPNSPQRLNITCPDGSGPGDLILIEGPDGEDIEVVVPDGVGPGETFEYDLDAGTGDDMQDTGPDSSPTLELELMTVECPVGSAAGDLLEVMSPRGQPMTVTVPDGVQPGDAFEFEASA